MFVQFLMTIVITSCDQGKVSLNKRNRVTGRFAPSSVHPLDVSSPGRIQRCFLIIQLKPKRLDVFTIYVTVCVCRAELRSYLLTYLLTYQGRNVQRANWQRGEMSTKQKQHSPSQQLHSLPFKIMKTAVKDIHSRQ